MKNLLKININNLLSFFNCKVLSKTKDYYFVSLNESIFYIFLDVNGDYIFIHKASLREYDIQTLLFLLSPSIDSNKVEETVDSINQLNSDLNISISNKHSISEAISIIADLYPLNETKTVTEILSKNDIPFSCLLNSVLESKLFIHNDNLALCLHHEKKLSNIILLNDSLSYAFDNKYGFWNSLAKGSEKKIVLTFNPLFLFRFYLDALPSDHLAIITHNDPEIITLYKILLLQKKFSIESIILLSDKTKFSNYYILKFLIFLANIQSENNYSLSNYSDADQIVFSYTKSDRAYKGMNEVQMNADLEDTLRTNLNFDNVLTLQDSLLKFLSYPMDTIKTNEKVFIQYRMENRPELLMHISKFLIDKYKLQIIINEL